MSKKKKDQDVPKTEETPAEVPTPAKFIEDFGSVNPETGETEFLPEVNDAPKDVAHLGSDLPTPAADTLENAQTAEIEALKAAQKAQYENMNQVLSDIDARRANLVKEDETAIKRAKAMRYISGIGDTLASVANLVGTAHGAQSQNQTYGTSEIVRRANEDISRRKEKYNSLSAKLDEAKARQRELAMEQDLAMAKLKVSQNRERLAEKIRKENAEREQKLAEARIQTSLIEAANLAAHRQAQLEETVRHNMEQEDIQRSRATTYQQNADTATTRAENQAAKDGKKKESGTSIYDEL